MEIIDHSHGESPNVRQILEILKMESPFISFYFLGFF